MALPAVLYDSLLERGALTSPAGTTAPGYDKGSVTLRQPALRWSVTGVLQVDINCDLGSGNDEDADCLAITGHNLGDASLTNILVQRSATGVLPWTTVGVVSSPSTNRTIFATFTNPGAFRGWRVLFNGPSIPLSIGAVALGRRLNFTEYMERGFDTHALTLNARTSIARTGSMVGVVTKHLTRRMAFKFGPSGLSRPAFHDVTGTPSKDDFLRTAWSNGRAFWFAWDGTGANNPVFVTAEKSRNPVITSTRGGWSMEPDVLDEIKAA